MPSVLDRILGAVWPELSALRVKVNALEGHMEAVKMKQEEVDAALDTIDTAISGITADIEALKAAQPVGSVMSEESFAKLTSLAARAAALDAENPATT